MRMGSGAASVMDRTSALVAAFLLALPVFARADSDGNLAEPASAFLASLTESERNDATWDFDSAERSDVHYAWLCNRQAHSACLSSWGGEFYFGGFGVVLHR